MAIQAHTGEGLFSLAEAHREFARALARAWQQGRSRRLSAPALHDSARFGGPDLAQLAPNLVREGGRGAAAGWR